MGIKLFDEVEVGSELERTAGTKRVLISFAVLKPGAGENLASDSSEKVPLGIVDDASDLFSSFTAWRPKLFLRLAA